MDIICRSAFGFKKVSRIDEEFEKHFNNLNSKLIPISSLDHYILFLCLNVNIDEINERIMDHTDWWHLLFPKRTKFVFYNFNSMNFYRINLILN